MDPPGPVQCPSQAEEPPPDGGAASEEGAKAPNPHLEVLRLELKRGEC